MSNSVRSHFVICFTLNDTFDPRFPMDSATYIAEFYRGIMDQPVLLDPLNLFIGQNIDDLIYRCTS